MFDNFFVYLKFVVKFVTVIPVVVHGVSSMWEQVLKEINSP